MVASGLGTLLDLDGYILVQEGGCWIKIEAREVQPTDQRPHGIKYSLTLHASNGARLLGYDNAHGIRRRGKKHTAQRLSYDHNHPYGGGPVKHYAFISPEQLLQDFFAEVDEVLKEIGET